MLNKQDFVFAPNTVTVRLQLQPVYNILNSLVLLNFPEERAGLPEWIVNTAKKLTPEEAQLNHLMLSIFNVLEPYSVDDDFDTYLHELENIDTNSLVQKYLEVMNKYLTTPEDIETMLSSEDHFLSLAEQMYAADKEEFHRPTYHMLYQLLVKPEQLKTSIIGHLRQMWDKYLRAEWTRNLSLLQESIKAFEKLDLSNLTALEAVRAITGRDMSSVWNAEEMKSTLIFVPSAHIGPYLTRFDYENANYILFGARVPEGTRTDSPALNRADLLVQLNALADETRLMILELLTEHEELCAQDIITMLNLSQSSASRHLRQLSASGYLIERRREVAKCYSLNFGRVKETALTLTMFINRKRQEKS